MCRYGETSLDNVPELKKHMCKLEDPDQILLHRAKINPKMARSIWDNTAKHYKGVEYAKTLNEYIETYENRYGTHARYDETSSTQIMSKEDSVIAMNHILQYQSENKDEWLGLFPQ